MIEITDENYPAILTGLTNLTRVVLQSTATLDIAAMRNICERFEAIAPIVESTAYQRGGDMNLRDQAALLAALDRFITDVRKLDRRPDEIVSRHTADRNREASR
jgi:flagellar biosynthesis/type III secretory pathway ATPase